MKTIRTLILEDDLQTLAFLMHKLFNLEHKLLSTGKKTEVAVTVLSEYSQVEEYINKMPELHFDIILLDRDCKAGGSFHVLDFTKYDLERIISISSVPAYNDEAQKRGIKNIIHKDFEQLDIFADKVEALLEKLIYKLIEVK